MDMLCAESMDILQGEYIPVHKDKNDHVSYITPPVNGPLHLCEDTFQPFPFLIGLDERKRNK